MCETVKSAEDKYSRNKLLIKKAQNGDQASLEELIKNNMGLVRGIAYKFRDRGTEYEDLVQLGTIGMLKAIHSYDEERGTAFSTYAVPLIIGEIRKFLRDDGLIKVSRVYKKNGMILMSARKKYIDETGKEPSISELAEICGMSREEAAFSIEATSPVHSLAESVYGEEDGITLENTVADEENRIDRTFDRIALGEALRKLPPLWQKIVLLRYFRDYTQQKTADILGISQVKISREEKKIVEQLRRELS